mmetsp:Transcript_7902/g.16472  ORF Transcript_7902/g.16472 Transcript_7902/m.16472 type:complete len:484 (-) Transcript_7902:198-1649(-)
MDEFAGEGVLIVLVVVIVVIVVTALKTFRLVLVLVLVNILVVGSRHAPHGTIMMVSFAPMTQGPHDPVYDMQMIHPHGMKRRHHENGRLEAKENVNAGSVGGDDDGTVGHGEDVQKQQGQEEGVEPHVRDTGTRQATVPRPRRSVPLVFRILRRRIREHLLRHPQMTPPQLRAPMQTLGHHQRRERPRRDGIQLAPEHGERQTRLRDVPADALPDGVALVPPQSALQEEVRGRVEGGHGESQEGVAEDDVGEFGRLDVRHGQVELLAGAQRAVEEGHGGEEGEGFVAQEGRGEEGREAAEEERVVPVPLAGVVLEALALEVEELVAAEGDGGGVVAVGVLVGVGVGVGVGVSVEVGRAVGRGVFDDAVRIVVAFEVAVLIQELEPRVQVIVIVVVVVSNAGITVIIIVVITISSFVVSQTILTFLKRHHHFQCRRIDFFSICVVDVVVVVVVVPVLSRRRVVGTVLAVVNFGRGTGIRRWRWR